MTIVADGVSLDRAGEDLKSIPVGGGGGSTLKGNIFNDNRRIKGTQLFKRSSCKGLSGHSMSRQDNQVSPLGLS